MCQEIPFCGESFIMYMLCRFCQHLPVQWVVESQFILRQDDLYSFPSLITRDNQLFLGLMNGFIVFSPENMVDNQCLNRPLFTSFRLFNVPVGGELPWVKQENRQYLFYIGKDKLLNSSVLNR